MDGLLSESGVGRLPLPTRDPDLDAICRLAAKLFAVPLASVSLLDDSRQWYVGREGLTGEGTPRDVAFCAWTLRAGPGVPLVVHDARRDPRFAGNPLVLGEPHLRFYAGIPLECESEGCGATFCIADTRPRPDFGEDGIAQLRDIATCVEAHLRTISAQRREKQETGRLRVIQRQLRTSEERLALALASGQDGLFDWDIAAGTNWVSEHWLAKLGHDGSGNATTDDWASTLHPDDRARFLDALDAHLRGTTEALECEHRVRRSDGTYMWAMVRARVARRGPDGTAQRLVGTLNDITQRKESEQRIRHMAMHDALTDLPNRHLFQINLDRALERAAETPNRSALLICDLDRFKVVNDMLGHQAGDRLLCHVAERLRGTVRPHDLVARLGGDEFAVILNDIEGEAEASRISAHIIEQLDKPVVLDGIPIDIGVSIGVALMGGPIDAAEIFKRADMALYQAKAAGRQTHRMFEAETHTRTLARSMIALDLREGLRRGDFFLLYQPVIDDVANTVVSFEALMRWNHPVHGTISPVDFIPVAEETGLIVQLGAWALKEATREAIRWPDHVRVAVNVSPVQFRGGLEEAVLSALSASGLPAVRLKLEVTESLFVQNPEQAIAQLHRLRGLGVHVALDDFGTGYSSLSYLRRFPFDKIKIDRAFIRDIADPDAAAIVRAVVGIGERLGMGIVAEGVETPEQRALVRQEGCAQMQGFLFSKPLPAPDALRFLASYGATDRASVAA